MTGMLTRCSAGNGHRRDDNEVGTLESVIGSGVAFVRVAEKNWPKTRDGLSVLIMLRIVDGAPQLRSGHLRCTRLEDERAVRQRRASPPQWRCRWLVCPRRAAPTPQRPIRIPEVPVRLALPRPVAHLFCNRQVLREVLDGLDSMALGVVPQRPIEAPEVPVRRALVALLRPVSQLLCNRQMLRQVLDGLGVVPQRLIRVAETSGDWPSSARSPTSFGFARCCAWYSVALKKFPSE